MDKLTVRQKYSRAVRMWFSKGTPDADIWFGRMDGLVVAMQAIGASQEEIEETYEAAKKEGQATWNGEKEKRLTSKYQRRC